LDEPIKEGSGPKINGSVMVAVAENEEEVYEKLKADKYWSTGVWDVDNVSQIGLNLRSLCRGQYRSAHIQTAWAVLQQC